MQKALAKPGSTTRKRQLNNTENVFLPRSQNSQDTPEIAQRRKEIVAIQREHRFLNRRGEAHSQTPPLYTPDEAPQDEAPQDEAPIPSLMAIPTPVSILPVSGQAPTAATPPVSAINWERIKKFRSVLPAECMEICRRCKERWFQMGVATEGDDIGVCKACIRDADRFKDLALPSLFGKGNELDPGPVPSFLPTLTAVEELLIACIYIHLQVVHIRGQQYRYTGHVCCFGQNIPKTWRQLPRLPAELDILIVRPATVAGAEYLSRRFRKW
jgi:hypothetical protein